MTRSHQCQSRLSFCLALAICVLLGVAWPAAATDFYYTQANDPTNTNPDSWNDGLNWSTGTVPNGGGGNFAHVDTGIANITNTPAGNTQDILFGSGSGPGGTVNQYGGDVTFAGGWLRMGQNNGTGGTYNLSGGTLDGTGGNEANIGEAPGSNPVLSIFGTGIFNENNLFVGSNGQGNLGSGLAGGGYGNSTGSVSVFGNSTATVGNGVSINSSGSLSVYGSAVFNANNTLSVQDSGSVTVGGVNGGGTLNVANNFAVGTNGNANASVLVSNGGTLSASSVTIGGNGGTSVFNQNGGNVSGAIQLGNGGTLNLNGGTLSSSGVTAPNGNGTFNLGGGTLQATASGTLLGTGLAGQLTNTSTINTGGNNVTNSAALSGSGSLSISGGGTYTATGLSTYTGSTNVSNFQNVAIGGSGLGVGVVGLGFGSNLQVGTPGLLGQYFSTGANQPSPANYTSYDTLLGHVANNYLGTGGGTSAGAATAPVFSLGGNGQTIGAATVPFPGQFANGGNNFETFNSGMINITNGGTYTFGTASDDGSVLFVDGHLVVNNNNFQGVGNENGNVGSADQATGTINLTPGEHNIAVGYYQGGGGYAVQADINGPDTSGNTVVLGSAGSPAITSDAVVGALSGVGNVQLNNGSLWIGAGNASGVYGGDISGNGAIYKIGTGTQYLANALGSSSFTGGTFIGGGTLESGQDGTFGAVPGSFSPNNITFFGNSTLQASQPLNLNANRGITINQGVTGTLDSNSYGITVPGAITGAGALAVTDSTNTLFNTPATVTLLGQNTYTGGTVINSPGTLQLGDGLNPANNSSLGTGSVSGNGSLVLNPAGASTVSNSITGGVSVTQTGNGSTNINGNNSYTGGTTIQSGGTIYAGGTALGTGTVNVQAGGTLTVSQASGLYTQYFNVVQDPANVGAALPNPNNFATLAAFESHVLSANPANSTPGSIVPGPSLVTPVLNLNTGGANFPNGVGVAGNANNSFEGYYSGMLNIPSTGSYTFTTGSDDGSMLWIDGKLVVSNNNFQGFVYPNQNNDNSTVTLTGGEHNIVVGYYQGTGGYALEAGASTDGGNTFSDLGTGSFALSPDLVIGSLQGAGTVNLNTGNLITGLDNTNTEFSGQITGIGGLTKLGTGTFILSGNNSYAGSTLIGGGTLQIGNGGPTGSLGSTTANVVNNGALVFNTSGNPVVHGLISGTGSVTQQGSGNTTLTNANTYTGGTTISGGTLTTGGFGLGTGPLAIASGGTLALTDSTTTGLASQYFQSSGPLAGQAANVPNPNYDSLAALQSHIGTNGAPNLLTDTPVVNLGGTGINAGTNVPFPAQFNNQFESYNSGMINIVNGGTYTFNTSSDDGSMLWIDGKQIVSNNNYQGVTTNTGTVTLSPGEHAIVVGYYQGTGGYGVDAQVSGPDTGNTLVDLGAAGSPTITPDMVLPNLTGGGNIQLTTANLIVGNDNTSTLYSGQISGVGGLTKFGTGTLTLTGNNTYTGDTSVGAGTLQVGNGGATGSLGNSANINVGGQLIFNTSSPQNVGGLISGSGSITQAGSGTTTFTNNNTYTGGTTVSGGTLTTGALGLGYGPLNVGAGSTLNVTLNSAGSGLTTLYYQENNGLANVNGQNPNFASLDALTSHIVSLGAPTLQTTTPIDSLYGSPNAPGITPGVSVPFPAPFTTNANNFESFKSGSINITTGGTYTFNTSSDDGSMLWVDGKLVASNNYTQGVTTRGGTITLSPGEHSIVEGYYQGGGGYAIEATINGPDTSNATTVLGNGGPAVTPDLITTNLSGGGNINLATANLTTGLDNTSTTFSGNLSGVGGLTKLGSGTLTMLGNNTNTGAITAGDGTLQFGNGGAGGTFSPSSNIGIGAGASLILNTSSNQTINGGIVGSGSLTQAGPGTTTINSNNTSFSGGTTVSGGTLTTGAFGIGYGSLNVASGATLNVTLPSAGNGLTTQYFQEAGLGANNGNNGLNDFNSLDALQTHVIGNGTPTLLTTSPLVSYFDTANNNNQFAGGTGFPAPFTANAANFISYSSGTITIAAGGTYNFQTSSDDGSMLWIDGKQIVNNNYFQGVATAGGSDYLAPGQHNIVIGYYQGGGGDAVQATINGPDTGNNTVALGAAGSPTLTPDLLTTNLSGGGTINLTSAGLSTGTDNTSTEFTGQLTGDFGLTKLGTGTLTLAGDNSANSGLTFISQGTLQVGDGTLTGQLPSGNVIIGGDGNTNAALVFNSPGTSTVYGVISGPGSLTQTGVGNTILVNNNTYTGPTTISGGTLQVGNGGTTGSLGTADVTDNGNLAFAPGSGTTFSVPNQISGTGTLTQLGPGTTVLTTQETYNGPTNVNGGTLQLNVGGNPGTLLPGSTININNGGTLLGGVTDALGYYGGSVGTININEGGTLSVAAGARLSMDSTVNSVGGTIATQPGAGDGTGQSYTFRDSNGGQYNFTSAVDGTPSTISAANLGLNGNVTFNVTAGGGTTDLLVTGNLADNFGTGNLIKNGNGVLVFANTAANTYSGSTTINGGTLQVGNGGSAGSLNSGPVIDNANLAFNLASPTSYTVNNPISGTGNLIQAGSGTTVLPNAETYNGNTTVSAGLLNITGSIVNNGSANVFVQSGGSAFGGAGSATGGEIDRSVAASAPYTGYGSQDFGLGTNHTTADINAGTAGIGAGAVDMSWRNIASNEVFGSASSPPFSLINGQAGLVSDVLNLNGMSTVDGPGTATDPFAVTLSYNPSLLLPGHGSEAQQITNGDIRLDWLNPGTGIWQTAATGDNLTGALALTTFQGTYGQFVAAEDAILGANYVETHLSQFLGSWGADPTTHTAWAIIDHNSAFAVAVPEPSSWVLACAGLSALLGVYFKRRRAQVQLPSGMAACSMLESSAG